MWFASIIHNKFEDGQLSLRCFIERCRFLRFTSCFLTFQIESSRYHQNSLKGNCLYSLRVTYFWHSLLDLVLSFTSEFHSTNNTPFFIAYSSINIFCLWGLDFCIQHGSHIDVLFCHGRYFPHSTELMISLWLAMKRLEANWQVRRSTKTIDCTLWYQSFRLSVHVWLTL